MGSGEKSKVVGYVAIVIAVAAVAVLVWQVYGRLSGTKKAESLFEKAGLPAETLAQVKIGMTPDQVVAITGEPLGKTKIPNTTIETWDWLTVVVRFKDGKVDYAGSSRIHYGPDGKPLPSGPVGQPPPPTGSGG
jgi:outer membrane protein assembly factor BamE (lipoprotein component of BamABCDE complex)